MRTDLTAEFQTQMSTQGRAPVQLGVFHFPISGDVYISDRDLGPSDGLSNTYKGIIESWGTLEDLIGDSFETPNAPTRQFGITLFNGGSPPFSNYILKEDIENVSFDLYQWFIGLSESDMALIDSFVVQDPIQFNERDRLLILDLVSVSMRYEALVGYPLTFDDFPNAKTEDIGKPVDLIVGNAGQKKTLCGRTAPTATLNGSILSGTMTIDVNENLDDLSFSASGTIQIDEEKIRYSSRTSSRFNVVQRGYLSEAAEHLDRDEITEQVADFTYLLGQGPIDSITDVKVGGFDAPSGLYTVHPEMDPARIIFTEKPYSYRFAVGSTFLEMQFDATNTDNTAEWPYQAYDAASDATAARIDEDHRKLSLIQATNNASRGEIVKVYLAVEHWEDKPISNDFAEVYMSGVGLLGRLSQPNPNDTVDLDLEVDLDHAHSHSISGEHTHTFQNPTYDGDADTHNHPIEQISEPIEFPGSPTAFEFGSAPASKNIYHPNIPGPILGGTLYFDAAVEDCKLKINGKTVTSGYNQSISVGPTSSYKTILYCYLGQDQDAAGSVCWIKKLKLEAYFESTIFPADVNVHVYPDLVGLNYDDSDKDEDDVEDLATDNQSVEINVANTSSHSHVNLFDITDHVNFDWAWFTDQELRIEYTGSADKANIYILHAFFDVEYRKRERLFSDDVSAKVTGIIDDGNGSITGSGDSVINRPDHVYKYLLTQKAGYPGSIIDDTSFDGAGSRFNDLGYTVDGVLPGSATVKDALKKIAFQTRSRYHFNGGKAKLNVFEKLEDWPTGRELTASNLQLRSMEATRQPVRDIVNKIHLFYQRDWTSSESDAAAYDASVTNQLQKSIDQHGERQKPDDFLFDLVRTSQMASDLVDFYIDRLGVPSTYYNFNLYLEQFDLERNDYIRMSYEDFHVLRKTKMMIAAINRVFGSGKNQSINQFQIMAEVLRYILHEVNSFEEVFVLDALGIEHGLEGTLAESVPVIEQLTTTHVLTFPESISVADSFSSISLFNPVHSETVLTIEALATDQGAPFEDNVKLLIDNEGWSHYGFGGGPYNYKGFGGYVIWRNRSPDETVIIDDLAMEFNFGTIIETATIADQLGISSGFGTPIGSGFGLVPFGK